MGKPVKLSEIINVYIRKVELKGKPYFSFKYRYHSRDEVKNFLFEEALSKISDLLGNVFLSAHLFTVAHDFQLHFNKKRKGRFSQLPPTKIPSGTLSHNKEKKRFVETTNNVYLQRLGVVDQEGKVIKSRQDKFKQINKYIEIVDNLIKQAKLPEKLHIVDMGSGKGYLTFALYDYLVNHCGRKVCITGIELREELVNICNEIAELSGFKNLKFISQDIHQYSEKQIDILIALHACDTATDEAICKGIVANAGLIICAPCCHKQIRKQMKTHGEMQAITQFGIFEERQAEMLTDTIRALILEANGYQSKVFEFISNEHTRKNVMLAGAKTGKSRKQESAWSEIYKLKEKFGIEYHYLERLMSK
nr:SAM-dependent methyltransferase [Xanthovirga aplysinae]